jgi:hypothetical protein
VPANFGEFTSLLKNPLYTSSGSPSMAQKPAIAVFWP